MTPQPRPRRVIAYIDGFNLYYGLKHACFTADWQCLRYRNTPNECVGRSLYWLDIHRVVRSHLRRSDHCASIKYFTAMRRVPTLVPVPDAERARLEASNERQRLFVEAVSSLPLVQVVLGWYSEKTPQTCACGRVRAAWEEKQTDVNIATHLLCDAFADRFDLALLMSADSDLVAPIQAVRALGKRVALLLPPGRKQADRIRSAADSAHNIKIRRLRGLTMPDVIERPGLPPLVRPERWKPPGGWAWRADPPPPAARPARGDAAGPQE